MTNYNEKIAKAENLGALENIVESLNEDIQNNAEITFDVEKLRAKTALLTTANKNAFSLAFAVAVDTDRKTAFESLLKNPTYKRVTVTENDNGTYSVDDTKTALFRFSDLESCYQLLKSTETDNAGQPVKNKSVSVFGATRFYGLCDCFIRNLYADNLSIDGEKVYNLAKVKIDNETIFTEKDGECFASNSNNALEKQLNLLVRFMGLDVKMLKKDLAPLKMFAQKVKRDISGKAVIRETKTLAFADILFGVITARTNGETVKAYTSNGKEIEQTQEKAQ